MIYEMITTVERASPANVPKGRTIRNLELRGPAGRLEALLNEGAPDARFAALVCHPHPKGGGTMHNRVVYNAARVLHDREWGFGFPVLRFNFRGTGLSEGVHDGEAEAEDVRAALDWLENAYNLPAVVVGFSFGAAMALRACCGDGRVQALAALGLPTRAGTREYRYAFLPACTIPKLFLSGDADEFAPALGLRQIAAQAAEPRELRFISGADHFFTGHEKEMQAALARWLEEQLR